MIIETIIDRLYPRKPENIPEKKSEQPYPRDVKAKRLPALAWLIANSSSMRGMIGAKIVLQEKFMNQRNQKNIRNRKAFPLRPVNFSIVINLLRFTTKIQCVVENKSGNMLK
jgi:hypothetical protein